MRLLRRNTTVFDYRAYTGEEEVLNGTLHTGIFAPAYAAPVQFRGNISVPSGFATDNLFGVNTQYTHVLVMDDPEADIKEDGLIDWKGATYEIKAVRPSLNVLSVALKKLTVNHAPPADDVTDDTTPADDVTADTALDGDGP